jgi:hypothetical protein
MFALAFFNVSHNVRAKKGKHHDTPPPLNATRLYQDSPGVRLLRLALGTSQRLWPALAVRAAYRLFGTPLAAQVAAAGAHAWDARWRADSLAVRGRQHHAVRPGLLCARTGRWCCWCTVGAGTRGQMLPLAECPGRPGLRPVLVEMPAHGRSRGPCQQPAAVCAGH